MRTKSLWWTSVWILSALSASSAGQEALHKSYGDESTFRAHGYSLAPAGDLNADGVPDYLMGAVEPNFSTPQGAVYGLSGVDSSILFTIEAPHNDELFAVSVAGDVDIDGDAVPDVLVGVPDGTATGGVVDAGMVYVFSGATQNVIYEVGGIDPLGEFGSALAVLDDMNNDGVAELAVGAPGDDSAAVDAGSVRVFSGIDGSFLCAVYGSGVNDGFGTAVETVPDANGDGWADLAVGAPRDDDVGTDCGSVQILSARNCSVLSPWAGIAASDELGHALAGPGDINDDGVPDYVVGAPGNSTVYALSGADGSVVWSLTKPPSFGLHDVDAMFGSSVEAMPDVDGDGRGDVAVGYPKLSGAWVLSGHDGTTIALYTGAAIDLPVGQIRETCLGWSLASIGDVNRDGVADLAIGAPLDVLPPGHGYWFGSATVVSGRWHEDWVLAENEHWGEAQGWAVSAAGDVNGDGADDYAVGAPFIGAGRVRVHSGADNSVLRELWGQSSGDNHGKSLACAGDVDADGVDDLIVGAPREGGASRPGGAWIYSGATGLPLLHFQGSTPFSGFGHAVAGLGDMNGDGRADVIVGAPQGPQPATGFSDKPGYVRVYSGVDGAMLREVVGVTVPDADDPADVVGEAFGYSVSGVGDWNVDGTVDFAVGIPGAGGRYGNGRVRVYSGVDAAVLSDFWMGPALFDREFGISVSGSETFDFNGDGRRDLVVGEQRVAYGPHQPEGLAWVFSSADDSVLWSKHVIYDTSYGQPVTFGYAVAALGDFNRDGFDDIAVGDPPTFGLLGPGAGEVSVYSGRDGGMLFQISGASSWDYLGYSVAAAGDANGDLAGDLVVGAPLGTAPNAISKARLLHGEPEPDVLTPSTGSAPRSHTVKYRRRP